MQPAEWFVLNERARSDCSAASGNEVEVEDVGANDVADRNIAVILEDG